MKIVRIILAVILLIYSVPTFLSLIDIYHRQEPDLSSEWQIFTIFFVLTIILILFNVVEVITGMKKKKTGN